MEWIQEVISEKLWTFSVYVQSNALASQLQPLILFTAIDVLLDDYSPLRRLARQQTRLLTLQTTSSDESFLVAQDHPTVRGQD